MAEKEAEKKEAEAAAKKAAEAAVIKLGRECAFAAYHGKTDEVKRLLGEKADPNWTDNGFYETSMHYTCIHGNEACARALLEKGGRLSVRNAKNETPVDKARILKGPDGGPKFESMILTLQAERFKMMPDGKRKEEVQTKLKDAVDELDQWLSDDKKAETVAVIEEYCGVKIKSSIAELTPKILIQETVNFDKAPAEEEKKA